MIKSLLKFKNSKHLPQLYLFLGEDRNYPGLLVLKDNRGKWIKESGKIWSLPALAQSKFNRSSDQTDGCTPFGIFKINSVMPKADKFRSFGRFRRLKIDFLSDREVKKLMPADCGDWWKEASIARDAGRKYLRIHGTGSVNVFKNSWYPFVRSRGCITLRETKKIKDQRILLDQLMRACQLEVKEQNEIKIQALLYVVPIAGIKRKIKLSDLNL